MNKLTRFINETKYEVYDWLAKIMYDKVHKCLNDENATNWKRWNKRFDYWMEKRFAIEELLNG